MPSPLDALLLMKQPMPRSWQNLSSSDLVSVDDPRRLARQRG